MDPFDNDDSADRTRKRSDKFAPGKRRREDDDSNDTEPKHSRKRSHRQRTHKDDFWDELR